MCLLSGMAGGDGGKVRKQDGVLYIPIGYFDPKVNLSL